MLTPPLPWGTCSQIQLPTEISSRNIIATEKFRRLRHRALESAGLRTDPRGAARLSRAGSMFRLFSRYEAAPSRPRPRWHSSRASSVCRRHKVPHDPAVTPRTFLPSAGDLRRAQPRRHHQPRRGRTHPAAASRRGTSPSREHRHLRFALNGENAHQGRKNLTTRKKTGGERED